MPLRLPATRHKYGAKPVRVDGIRFASTKEANYYLDLRLLLRAGEIRDLELQPKFPLSVNGVTLGHYVGDFKFFDVRKHCTVVVDCKGVKLPLYRWKAKHMHAEHGITITEI